MSHPYAYFNPAPFQYIPMNPRTGQPMYFEPVYHQRRVRHPLEVRRPDTKEIVILPNRPSQHQAQPKVIEPPSTTIITRTQRRNHRQQKQHPNLQNHQHQTKEIAIPKYRDAVLSNS
ncbi:hypothetical protein BASA81_001911 [Batrachochytrium salamandrivorans]|nr:hypothetical protein BASA81_001911 [Batrachochytrium salamandrivorans]